MIKEKRILIKMSQETLAEKVGLSWRQIQRIENDEYNTTVNTFTRIAKALNFTDDEIVSYIRNAPEIG